MIIWRTFKNGGLDSASRLYMYTVLKNGTAFTSTVVEKATRKTVGSNHGTRAECAEYCEKFYRTKDGTAIDEKGATTQQTGTFGTLDLGDF